MSSFPELQNRTVVVTGGASGIGASIVRAFHRQKARVFFCDMNVKMGRALAVELGEGVEFAKVDLRAEKDICRWVAEIGKRAKSIDVLVNNAANDRRCPLDKVTAAAWDEMFALNLRAYFLMCREASPLMPKRGASIVNFSSITFHLAPPEMSAYVATKGGIMGFTRSLARELGPRKIRVNTVSPGWVMTERQLHDYVTPAIKRMLHKSQCIPELLKPEDIADVVVFLGSDASRAMTGQELLVDRGWAHS